METMSHPGTTSSMKDYFERGNPDNESESRICKADAEMERQRSHSLESDLAVMRDIGVKSLRSSTQGYLLFRAK